MLCSAESHAICVLGCSGFKHLSIYGSCSTFLKRIHSMEVALWVMKTIQRLLKLFLQGKFHCCSIYLFGLNIRGMCHVCNTERVKKKRICLLPRFIYKTFTVNDRFGLLKALKAKQMVLANDILCSFLQLDSRSSKLV